jgi:hypothetical protein
MIVTTAGASTGGAKVVVRLRNGKVFKGFATRFHAHNANDLRLVEYGTDRVRVIPYSILKAVFFVRDFMGNPTYEDVKAFPTSQRPGGKESVIYFEDGEELFGFVQMAHPDRNGFFVFPADPRSNNERIYVIRTAVREVK